MTGDLRNLRTSDRPHTSARYTMRPAHLPYLVLCLTLQKTAKCCNERLSTWAFFEVIQTRTCQRLFYFLIQLLMQPVDHVSMDGALHGKQEADLFLRRCKPGRLWYSTVCRGKQTLNSSRGGSSKLEHGHISICRSTDLSRTAYLWCCAGLVVWQCFCMHTFFC